MRGSFDMVGLRNACASAMATMGLVLSCGLVRCSSQPAGSLISSDASVDGKGPNGTGPFADIPFPTLGESDYSDDPLLGFPIAKRHVLVAFRDEATLSEAAGAISSIDARLVGALGEARIALVELPDGLSTSEKVSKVESLSRHPSVESAALDMLLYPTSVPATSTNTASWNWSNPATAAGNWGLRAMGMPVAWNLKTLIEGEPSRRRVRTLIVDTGFQRHPDLPGEVFSLTGGDFAPEASTSLRDATQVGHWHGTAVAGVIGARWDARYVDGISPFVDMVGTPLGQIPSTWNNAASAYPVSFANTLSAVWSRVSDTQVRPRLVNMSLGFNHLLGCYGLGTKHRCDPRQGSTEWGTPAQDSSCDGASMRSAIVQTGLLFDRLARSAQSAGPTLFVVAAGNDSGTYTGDYCANPGAGPGGLGLFPAELASPMAWAGTRGANPHILVVEVVQSTYDMRGALQRASYSNVNGHILAPGDRVDGLAGGGSSATVLASGFSGTSAATPHVTGAAAWLLNLNPYLENVDLRALLLSQEGTAPSGTNTRARLFLPTAIESMSVVLPGSEASPRTVRGAKVLADMDDGSVDGLSKRIRDGRGASPGPYTERRDFRLGAPTVNMADFRYLRDTAFINAGLDLECRVTTPACDLNGNTVIDREDYPRALLLWPANTGESAVTGSANLAKLSAQWDVDAVQGYRPEEFPALLNSADFYVEAGDFLTRGGATGVRISLGGTSPLGSSVPEERLMNLSVGTEPVVLTSPLTTNPTVKITVVGGPHDGRVFDKTLTSLTAAQDFVLYLNPCALREGSQVDILAPYMANCPGEDAGVEAGPVDSGRDPDAFIDRTCADLEAGTDPYFCFSLGGGGLTRQVVSHRHPLQSTSIFRAYYYAAGGHTFIRMNGDGMFDGVLENVDFTLTMASNSVTSEPWPIDGDPYAPHVTFFEAGTRNTKGDFAPLPQSDSSGNTTLTRYGAVGEMVEGTFSGKGKVWRFSPTAEYQPVDLNGSFRVKRDPDN